MYQRFRSSFTRHLLMGYMKWWSENADLKVVHLVIDISKLEEPNSMKSIATPEGTVYLNLSPTAVRLLTYQMDGIALGCDIKGVPRVFNISYQSMLTIYSFTEDGEATAEVKLFDSSAYDLRWVEPDPNKPAKRTPQLRVVK